MVFVKDWDDFEMTAESMYLQNPNKCRYSMKYIHSKGQVILKLSDNIKVCKKQAFLLPIINILLFKAIQYKSDVVPDLKKIERLTGNLMGHMALNP